MKVLIACEFSGVVRRAFHALGHDAWSCDILPAEDKSPYHYTCDVRELLWERWDLIIAFPPCTHLCSSGAQYWPVKRVDGRQQRAIEFVDEIWAAKAEKVCIENPVGVLSKEFKKPSQIIHPFQFGDPYLKRTCLWVRGILPLVPTNVVLPVAHWHSGSVGSAKKKDGKRYPAKLPTAKKNGWKERSRTFEGIARAMAEQWGDPMNDPMF